MSRLYYETVATLSQCVGSSDLLFFYRILEDIMSTRRNLKSNSKGLIGTMTTILLVEDESDLAQVITRELEAAGYRALRAAEGIVALEVHAREQIDLVILDWMLPRMNGLDVLRHLRQTAATPVLMLT